MKILLGVTGSISAYKSVDLARMLQKRGHEVKVVLTHGALEFVQANVFKYLGIPCYQSNEDFQHENVLHIELARWAQMMVIAPLSAHTLSQLAQGACPDLLTSVWLSARPETIKIVSPAMNSHMLSNSITQHNLFVLQKQGVHSIAPDEGELACGDVGEGKLPQVHFLCEVIEATSNKSVNKRVVITAGATLSNIDTIRYVTNPAKGGTALHIAKKYLSEGYEVHVIKGAIVVPEFDALLKHPRYSQQTVITTQDLLDAVKIQTFDIYISPMAVSDLEFETADKKLKKSALSNSLTFKEAPDVLAYVVKNKQQHQQIVGFAAESTLDEEVIKEKITRKPVDLLVANLADGGFVSGKALGFGTLRGFYKLVTPTKTYQRNSLDKKTLANLIFNLIK